jgi:hypothetical protein
MLPIVDVDTIVEPGASALAISSSSIPTYGVEMVAKLLSMFIMFSLKILHLLTYSPTYRCSRNPP